MTEIYKVKNGIAPDIVKDIFELQNPSYNLRSSCNQFRRDNIKTVHYGLLWWPRGAIVKFKNNNQKIKEKQKQK